MAAFRRRPTKGSVAVARKGMGLVQAEFVALGIAQNLSDAVYRQLRADSQPNDPAAEAGPGAQRGDTSIQRGRPDPAHRHFGSATTRARTTDATRPTTDPTPLRSLAHSPT
jgi:hypothetical protein